MFIDSLVWICITFVDALMMNLEYRWIGSKTAAMIFALMEQIKCRVQSIESQTGTRSRTDSPELRNGTRWPYSNCSQMKVNESVSGTAFWGRCMASVHY